MTTAQVVIPLPPGTFWEPSVPDPDTPPSLLGVQVYALVMFGPYGSRPYAIDGRGNVRKLLEDWPPAPDLGTLYTLPPGGAR